MAQKAGLIVDDISTIINESIRFEEFVDKIDFDSWLKEDENNTVLPHGQNIGPLNVYKANKKELLNICEPFIQTGNSELDKDDEQGLEKFLVYHLFHSKEERIDAKIVSKKNGSIDERKYFENAVDNLHIALGVLLQSQIKNKFLWKTLFYNDLSICYAGIKNSSLSRGYAEETIRLIKEDGNLQSILDKISKSGYNKIKKSDPLSSAICDLYLFAIFNKAESERRSNLFEESEKNFREIRHYGKKYGIKNFNYYTALLRLGLILTDQGRGKEAIVLLDETLHVLDESDARFWDAYLERINALVDQTEYDLAIELLNTKFNSVHTEGDFALVSRHAITHQGFDALNYYLRCVIQKVSNTLKININEKRKELIQLQTIIEKHIDLMIDRKQKEAERTAYKSLGEINTLLAETYEEKDEKPDEKDEKLEVEYLDEALTNFCNFLAKGKLRTDLKSFINNYDEISDSINQCDDLSVLEDILNLIAKKNRLDRTFLKQSDVLDCLENKIKKICESKSDLSRIGRISSIIKEIKNEKHPFIDEKTIPKHETNFCPDEKTCNQLLTKEEIRTRLDNNEKEFDNVLFGKKGNELKHKLRLPTAAEVVILKRWNSFSPGLFRKDAKGSLGGGYVIRINRTLLGSKDPKHKVETIVIDPGYNFIQNFCNEGFSINEVDTIIVTHSHLDHCADLLAMMDLIFQINKRYERWSDKAYERKRITLCLSMGAYNKFSSYIRDWEKQLKDVIILENLPEETWKPYLDLPLEIAVTKTPHNDLGNLSAIGVKIRINTQSEKICLGFTGDTPYYKNMIKFFKECDLLCVHLGSIKYPEIGCNSLIYNCEPGERTLTTKRKIESLKKTHCESSHLCSYGTEKLVQEFSNIHSDRESLVLVGEFGEELKYGLRTDFCEKLSDVVKNQCIAADIGLHIRISNKKAKSIRCNFCEHYVPAKEIKTFSYGREDAIQYICKSCKGTLSDLQKQALVEYRLTRH